MDASAAVASLGFDSDCNRSSKSRKPTEPNGNVSVLGPATHLPDIHHATCCHSGSDIRVIAYLPHWVRSDRPNLVQFNEAFRDVTNKIRKRGGDYPPMIF